MSDETVSESGMRDQICEEEEPRAEKAHIPCSAEGRYLAGQVDQHPTAPQEAQDSCAWQEQQAVSYEEKHAVSETQVGVATATNINQAEAKGQNMSLLCHSANSTLNRGEHKGPLPGTSRWKGTEREKRAKEIKGTLKTTAMNGKSASHDKKGETGPSKMPVKSKHPQRATPTKPKVVSDKDGISSNNRKEAATVLTPRRKNVPEAGDFSPEDGRSPSDQRGNGTPRQAKKPIGMHLGREVPTRFMPSGARFSGTGRKPLIKDRSRFAPTSEASTPGPSGWAKARTPATVVSPVSARPLKTGTDEGQNLPKRRATTSAGQKNKQSFEPVVTSHSNGNAKNQATIQATESITSKDMKGSVESTIGILFYDNLGKYEMITHLNDVLRDLHFTVTFEEDRLNRECTVVFQTKQHYEEAMKIFKLQQKECRHPAFTVLKDGDKINELKRELASKRYAAVSKHKKQQVVLSVMIENLYTGGKRKGKRKRIDLHTFEIIQTLKEKQEDSNRHLEQFTMGFNDLICKLDEKRMKTTDLKGFTTRLQREINRLENALPIYAKKSDIVETVRRNQVSVVVGETGSGKSTQMAQYLFDAGLAPGNQQIVCTQPRKVAATSLAQQVAKEMGSKVGQLVGHRVGSSQKANKDTKVVYTTDHALLMECIKDNNLSKYSCIVVDEAHERSIHTDLLLGIIKKTLPRRPDLRVIITSATIDPSLFQDYLGGCCPVIKVSGRLFPVEVFWKEKAQFCDTSDYVSEAVATTLEIHRYEDKGDILVFLTSPAEIDRAKDKLTESCGSEDIVCLPLHGKLQQEEQQKVFQPFPGKRKIVLSTNCAETSVTIPGIKFVVDTGRVKEMRYDEKRGINILEVSVVSQSSAEQRKGRAGRTDSGKCYRLYTEDEFKAMAKGSRPEILRVHLGQAIVKLMVLGVKDPVEFDYVEPPPRASITSALETLVKLGAINNGMLTELGRKMSKVPIEPRLAKFLFQGIEDGVGLESLVICSTATVNGSVFFRMGTEEEKKQADVRKVQFCQPEGDFLTLLSVYREWWNVDPKHRNRWCFERSLNAKALRLAKETVKELQYILEKELRMDVHCKWSTMDDRTVKETLQRNILPCFSENLCVFSGNARMGYKTIHDGNFVKLHPSTSFNLADAQPKFLVYEKTLRTSQEFILNVTAVEECWVEDAAARGEIELDLETLYEEILIPIQITCSKSLRKVTLTPVKQKIEDLQQMIQCKCNVDVVVVESKPDSGFLEVFAPRKYHENVVDVMNEYLEEGKKTLRKMKREHAVTPGSNNVRMVLGKGCVPSQILMAGMFRSVIVRYARHVTETEEVLDVLERYGALSEYSVQDTAIFATYENPEDAKQAVGTYTRKEQGDEAGADKRTFTVAPNCVDEWQTRREHMYGLDVRISWTRRLPSGRATIELPDNVELLEMTTPSPLIISNRYGMTGYAVVSWNVHRQNSLFIKHLNRGTTKSEIKAAFEKKYGVEIEDMDRQIILQYEKREETTDEELEEQAEELHKLIEKFADDDDFTLKVLRPTKPTDITANAFAKFKYPAQGIHAAKNLNGVRVSGLEYWRVKLDVACNPKTTLTCPKFVYDAVGTEMTARLNGLQQVCEEQCGTRCRVEVLPAKSKARMVIKLDSQCLEHYQEAFAAVANLITGCKIDCSASEAHKVLLSNNSRGLLKEAETSTGAVIRAVERDTVIYIYGTNANVESAYDLIQGYLKEMQDNGCEVIQIDLRAPDKPRGLLKEMMCRFGGDLAGLGTIPGVKIVRVDVKRHVVTLYATPPAFEKVVEEIKSAGADLPERTERGPLLNECPVCLCEVSQPSYRLSICGHEYCQTCVQELVNAKQFPLICSNENCEEEFTLLDLDSLTRKDEKESFLRAALEWYVKTNQDKVRHCPSPDCPMVYRATTDGKPFKCHVCLNTVCTSCHEFGHVGITCEERKLPEANDWLRWINEDPQRRKRCPECKTGIEKTVGCNHMLCVACETHMCWLCLKIFPSDSGVYNHLPYCRNNQS